MRASTTGYLEDAIDAQEADGQQVSEEAKAHMSFAHFEAINPYGSLIFDIASVLKRSVGLTVSALLTEALDRHLGVGTTSPAT